MKAVSVIVQLFTISERCKPISTFPEVAIYSYIWQVIYIGVTIYIWLYFISFHFIWQQLENKSFAGLQYMHYDKSTPKINILLKKGPAHMAKQPLSRANPEISISVKS